MAIMQQAQTTNKRPKHPHATDIYIYTSHLNTKPTLYGFWFPNIIKGSKIGG